MKRFLLALLLALVMGAANAQAAPPGPLWNAEPSPPDPQWSETYYPVAQNAVRPRTPFPGETRAEARALDRAWEGGIRTYLRRVSHMVGGMNIADEHTRQRECAAMGRLLDARFIHREGRRGRAADGSGGFAQRTKSELLRACDRRAFRLDGFYALHIRAIAFSPNLVQVTTCYYHDQWNDPLVVGGGHVLPNGRQAIPRISVETLVRKPGRWMQIAMHVALDSDEAMIRGGCGAP